MVNASFASLNAGMLARKGEAQPSKEPKFGSRPWDAPVAPAGEVVPGSLADIKVRLQEVESIWPAPKRAAPAPVQPKPLIEGQPNPPLNSLGHPLKTTVRLSHQQARAVRLAALVLDRPQQEILTAGMFERLEALACSDLADCTCFKAVLQSLKRASEAP
jgi:hypothetical protein